MTDKDIGETSDGYHTFNELYEHRCYLFVALMRCNPKISWRAEQHEDGSMYQGWFIAGMQLPSGQISYHMPMSMWDAITGSGIKTSRKAPKWDGHTPADVVKRLAAWLES